MIIISPPFFSPNSPLLGAYLLYESIKEVDNSVQFIDLNLLFYKKIVKEKSIISLLNKIRFLINSGKVEKQTLQQILLYCYIVSKYLNEFLVISERVYKKSSTVNEDRQFYNYLSYLTLLLSFIYRPSHIRYYGFIKGKGDLNTANELLSYIKNEVSNPLYYIYPEIVEIIQKDKTSEFLVSVTYESQLLAALTFCYIGKQIRPCKIAVGGQVIKRLGLSRFIREFGFIDYFDENALNSSIIINDKEITVYDLRDCTLPKFEDIDFNCYLNSRNLLPVKVSRGCYWSKCKFCAIHYPHDKMTNLVTVERVIDYIIEMKKNRQIDMFWFVDEAIPAKWLTKFSKQLINSNQNVSWSLNGIRLEKGMNHDFFKLIKNAGCQAVSFGLESYDQRMLNLMYKGTYIEDIQRLIDQAYDSGLKISLSAFLGYPGETLESIESTRKFILKNSAKIRSALVGIFRLEKHSPIANNPENHGIKREHYLDRGPFSLYLRYKMPEDILSKAQQVVKEIKSYFNDPLKSNVLYMDKIPDSDKLEGKYENYDHNIICEKLGIINNNIIKQIENIVFQIDDSLWVARLIKKG